jgi:hypothetical protein
MSAKGKGIQLGKGRDDQEWLPIRLRPFRNSEMAAEVDSDDFHGAVVIVH